MTILYAGILGLFSIGLSLWVIYNRFKYKVSLQDGGHPELLQTIRIHGNFHEYIPLCLLLLYFCEINGLDAQWVHCAGGSLIMSRLLHARGMLIKKTPNFHRFTGTVLLMTCLGLLSIYLISTSV